jgi:uncharacterized protein (TIGR03118 family)
MTDDETDTLLFKGDSMFQQSALKPLRRLIAVCFAMSLLGSTTLLAQTYVQTNLVSDIPGLAPTTDHFLVNPWGIARAPAGPWWVSDNGTGVSTLYTGAGVPVEIPAGVQFVVNIPNAPGSSGNASPTGTVFNGSTDFHGDVFIFVSEDGIISGWNPAVNLLNAVIEVNHSATAIYKGVTIASFSGSNYLYAADFHTGVLEIFDKNFQPFSFGVNAFVDPQIPDGFGPFNVQAIGNAVVVTYAKQDKDAEDEVAGKGLGFVDVFTPNGTLLMRLESGDWMNAPWGVALAPANFGELSNRLLIGNFGSGQIAAFDAEDGSFVSFLKQSPGAPMKINGLWGLEFGNGGPAGPTNSLFFAAGHANEHHGLFGTITAK